MQNTNNIFKNAFTSASSRLTPRKVPLFSQIIPIVVLVTSLLIFVMAYFAQGIFAWSAGLAYIFYDTALLVFVAVQTLSLIKNKNSDHKDNQNSPLNVQQSSIIGHLSVGVIIAAYNEAEVLERTIHSLLNQREPPEQILIADDGSNDGTAQLLMDQYGFNELTTAIPTSKILVSANYPILYWLCVVHGGKALALNQAIPEMHTDIVITVDADTLLAPRAIGVMRSAFTDELALVAATGVLTPVCSHKITGQFLQWFQTYEYIRNFISRFAWMKADSLLLISGAFAGFRRNALVTVGGFDPHCLVEDYELIHRMRRYAVEHELNWQVRVLGNAQARTSAPSTFYGFLQQRRRWFAGFLQTQYWHRDMIANRRYGNLGMWMLPVKTIDTVQPFFGLIAFFFLIYYLASGKLKLLVSIFVVIGIKILVDLCFHCWSIFLYKRWTNDSTHVKFSLAIVAAILEPFTFQLLRHTGAVLGWYYFLTGRKRWGKQQRHQII